MPGLDPNLVVHTLNMEPGTKLVAQSTRVFHTGIEVKKLFAVGFIKSIRHPKWLSIIVLVKKKNG